MSILVVAQSHRGKLAKSTARLVTAAQMLGEGVQVLVVDSETGTLAAHAARLEGVERVLVALHPRPDEAGFFEIAATVEDIAGEFQIIMAADSGAGRYILPLVSARLKIPALSGVSRIIDAHRFERPVHAGALLEEVELRQQKTLLTIATNSFSPTGQQSAPCEIVPVAIAASGGAAELFVQGSPPSPGRPELPEAGIVIAGGGGMGSKEGFARLEALADCLDGAIGASRVAVDRKWAPHSLQIGQTGVQIAPDFYLAFGISGAVQHMAGIREAGKIIAINKDREAAIFRFADYGIVADLFDILPGLQEALVDKKGSN